MFDWEKTWFFQISSQNCILKITVVLTVSVALALIPLSQWLTAQESYLTHCLQICFTDISIRCYELEQVQWPDSRVLSFDLNFLEQGFFFCFRFLQNYTLKIAVVLTLSVALALILVSLADRTGKLFEPGHCHQFNSVFVCLFSVCSPTCNTAASRIWGWGYNLGVPKLSICWVVWVTRRVWV